MQKQVISVILIFVASLSWAQSQRRVLIEEFNNVSAPNQAQFTPAFSGWLENNPDKYTLIRYITNSPDANPLWTFGVDERMGYYNHPFNPIATVDGILPDSNFPGFNNTWYAGAPAGFGSSMIVQRFDSIAASFGIDIDFNITANQINATVNLLCTDEASGSLKLRVAVIETEVALSSSPGSNGHLHYTHIFRGFMTGPGGINLGNNWTTGQSGQFNLQSGTYGVIDFSKIAVVAFVQNDNNREVLQSEVQHEFLVLSPFQHAANVQSLQLPDEVCGGETSFAPHILIRNTGNQGITEVSVEASVNGNITTRSFEVNIASLNEQWIDFGDIELNSLPENVVTVNVLNVNGNPNEQANSGQTGQLGITQNQLGLNLHLMLFTDCYPEETSWRIADNSGDVVASGGPYTNQPNDSISISLELSPGCYRFEYFDTAGDGLFGSQWNGCASNGSFAVSDLAGNVLFNYDGSFNLGYWTALFETDLSNALEETKPALPVVRLYPNPSKGFSTLETDGKPVESIRITDLTGKTVYQHRPQSAPTAVLLNLQHLSRGLYIVQIEIDQQHITQKLVIQ